MGSAGRARRRLGCLGWLATLGEVACAAALLAGRRLREAALASGALLTAFALAMTFAEGVKSPLDCSVYTAAAGAFLLAAWQGSTGRPGTVAHL